MKAPRRSLALLWLTIAPALLHATSIVAYVEAPSVQTSSVGNITTENFNSIAAGIYTTNYVSAIGTYVGTSSNKYAIVAADQFGGAGGTGNYFAIGAQSGSATPVTLNLNAEANYFGFWWSAGDANNAITFLQNGTALATFTTANLIALLPDTANGTVTAINGTSYHTNTYYGNPNNTSQDTNEPFAYVDIIATGIQFNQIQFSNSNTTGSGFESDNHSVANGVSGPPGGDVLVQNVPLTPAAVPEPGTWALLLSGLAAAGLMRSRRTATIALNIRVTEGH